MNKTYFMQIILSLVNNNQGSLLLIVRLVRKPMYLGMKNDQLVFIVDLLVTQWISIIRNMVIQKDTSQSLDMWLIPINLLLNTKKVSKIAKSHMRFNSQSNISENMSLSFPIEQYNKLLE